MLLSERCKTLRDQAVDTKPDNAFKCAQRDFYFYKGVLDVPPERRRNVILTAEGTARVIREAPPLIGEGELLVGYNYGDAGFEFLSGDPGILRGQLEGSGLTKDGADWFIGRREEARSAFTHRISDYPMSERDLALLDEVDQLYGLHILTQESDLHGGNHSVLAYEKVLRMGFEGLLREVERCAAANTGQNPDLYESMRIVCRAACELGERYAAHALCLAETCADPARKKELLAIADRCARVPRHPARNFGEALQSLWFAHIVNTWEDYINANSLGRLDQILYPYYQADIEKGALTRDEAFELVCCLWIKLYRDYDVQQSCVGGCRADGSDAVNELSWLMLDATEALDFVRCLSVRFSQNTDKAFVRRALEVVGRVRKGIPFFFNDDVMIPALVSHGISLEDARDYSQIGCVETVIPGKSNPHAVVCRCNVLKAVEYAFADGRTMREPVKEVSLHTGDPSGFDTYAKLEGAVRAQLAHMLEICCMPVVRCAPLSAVNYPKPYKSLLTDDCMRRGLDYNAAGAKYDYYQVCLMGLPNLADSLAAIRKLVYREKRYTIAELTEHLRSDWPDEAVRLDFLRKAPKFGNDIPEVDDIAKELLDFCCDRLQEISAKYRYDFHAQPFTFVWMIENGAATAATPDGRRSGEILAYSASPMQGRDESGFTALLNSISGLPTARTPGTTSAIVEADPALFTDRNLDVLASLLMAAGGKGLNNVQFNTVDAETLIDAQQHPERHRNLAVRVSGFSQKFYLLGKELQDHIIRRTKHTSL